MKLSTEVMHRLCATPKSTLNNLLTLTGLVRWFRLKRAAEAGSSQGRNRLMGKVYAIAALLSITTTLEANAANYSIDHLKLYSHSRLLDWKEFSMFQQNHYKRRSLVIHSTQWKSLWSRTNAIYLV